MHNAVLKLLLMRRASSHALQSLSVRDATVKWRRCPAGDSAQARAILAALPRTANAIFWVAHSSLEYSRCVAAHPSRAGGEYAAALEETHQRCADRLLKLCQVG